MKYISEVVSSGTKLTNVFAYIHPDLVKDQIVISLRFGSKHLQIEVLEDDSLSVSFSANTNGYIKVDLTNDSRWKGAINKPIRWGWLMKNNYGYSDGVQFEFSESVSDEMLIIQLLGISSRIDTRIVKIFD